MNSYLKPYLNWRESETNKRRKRRLALAWRTNFALLLYACCFIGQGSVLCAETGRTTTQSSSSSSIAANRSTRTETAWRASVSSVIWIAYSPTNADPGHGIEPDRESVVADLTTLRRAGFTGLVTYGSSGFIGQLLPSLAKREGFSGLIIGIWDPLNSAEMVAAIAAAKEPIVLGLCVGNEGLNKRYRSADLRAAIDSLRKDHW